MLEWHIYEDERGEMNLPEEPCQRAMRGRFIIIGLLLLTSFGLLARWQVVEGKEAMREDLIALIEQEERVRSFGLKEEAAKFLAPGVPDEWKKRYLATLTEPDEDEDESQDQAGTVEVEEVLFDGEAALVSVRRNYNQQMQYYRLVKGSWRRAPLPAQVWGESAVISAVNGIKISYYERDKAFAHALARDLDGLKELPDWSKQLSLRIEPAELQGALLVQSIPLPELGFMRRAKTEIVLNSPLTVQSRLDGEAASSQNSVRLRLALAELLNQDLSESGLDIDSRRNTGSQLLEGIQAIQISDLTANTIGVNQGALTHEMLEQDSNNSTPYDDLTDGVFFITTTVPADAYSLVAETIDASANDFSLFVGVDSNENGMPDASEQLCSSSTPTAIEICELVNPVSGTYWIMVQNRVASISAPDFVTLVTAVVYDSDRDHLEGTP